VSEDKTLTRIAALLRQAEGTDNEHEADAFMQAAQRLATAASIDLAVARSHTADRERRSSPIIERVEIGDAGTKGLRTYAQLFMAIGHANDVVFDVAHNSTYVIGYGFSSDIETTKALYASIAVQMVRASDQYIKSGDYRAEQVYRRVRRDGRYPDWQPRPVHATTARINFQQAYSVRIGARLAEAREQTRARAIRDERERTNDGSATTRAVTDGETSPVTGTELALRDKDVEIKDFRKANSNARGAWRGAKAASGHSDHARRAGDRAARHAHLGEQPGISSGQRAIGGDVSL